MTLLDFKIWKSYLEQEGIQATYSNIELLFNLNNQRVKDDDPNIIQQFINLFKTVPFISNICSIIYDSVQNEKIVYSLEYEYSDTHNLIDNYVDMNDNSDTHSLIDNRINMNIIPNTIKTKTHKISIDKNESRSIEQIIGIKMMIDVIHKICEISEENLCLTIEQYDTYTSNQIMNYIEKIQNEILSISRKNVPNTILMSQTILNQIESNLELKIMFDSMVEKRNIIIHIINNEYIPEKNLNDMVFYFRDEYKNLPNFSDIGILINNLGTLISTKQEDIINSEYEIFVSNKSFKESSGILRFN